MAEDAAPSGAQSDADSSPKGEPQTTDAGATGEQQPDLDKIVAARVAQKLKQYGDLEQLKSKAARLDSLEESQKSETQKLQDRIAALEQERSQLEQERRTGRRYAAVVSAAARMGFSNPEQAARYLNVDSLEFDEQDAPLDIDQKLKELSEAIGARPRTGWDSGVRPPAKPEVQPGLARLQYAYTQSEKRKT